MPSQQDDRSTAELSQMARLRAALIAEARAHPLARKLLVCGRRGDGREALRALARDIAWAGFEPVTPLGLANEFAAPTLAAEAVEVADEFEEAALLDEAIDAVLRTASAGPLRELADGPGFRQAMANAVQALRLSGIDAGTLQSVPLRDPDKQAALVRIHAGYERLLQERKRIDAAGVFRVATQSLAAGTLRLPDARILIMPGQNRRGLSGRLLDLLVARGATVLPADPVFGLVAPLAWLRSAEEAARAMSQLSWLHAPELADAASEEVAIALFTAASIPDELREVLRRIMAQGLHWDEVEIIATDAMTYGTALDSLSRRLDIPVSYAVGLPADRTRPGRAVHAYLRWVRDGFPAEILRGMLERGDLGAPDNDSTGPTLARRLRRMQIGRGRDRYLAALERAERALTLPPSPEDERTPEDIAADLAREHNVLAALGAIVRPILAATPDVPDRLRTADVRVSPAALAHGLLEVLRLVPAGSIADATARLRLGERLSRIAATATRATTIDAAVAILEARLETRVPAANATGNAPWSSSGGYLHLTDIEHGGYSGRRATFIVGLDAARFPGMGAQDALLADDDRRRLSAGQEVSALATSADRAEERRFALAELLARLRGQVTLSYSSWDAAEARGLAPSAELLQAFRLQQHDRAADYDRMRNTLAIATAIPRGDVTIDETDVWLDALSLDGLLREGTTIVRAAFPGLGAGLHAQYQRKQPVLSAHLGRITPRPALDPRLNEAVVASASRLEGLGSCPHRYLLRSVLRVYPPDDPELQPDAWLTALDRGSLLHKLYEQTLRNARNSGVSVHDDEFVRIADRELDRQVQQWREVRPPPGAAVFRKEIDALRADVSAFVQMVRDRGADWIELEAAFGRMGMPVATLPLPGGRAIRLAGAIDRVDRLPDGSLVVIDYKTGSPYLFARKDGILRGGRRLQHVLYSAIAEMRYNAAVARAEYHFPTLRGRFEIASYDRETLRAGLDVVDQLLDIVAAGWFHPTIDPDDCKICDFVEVCRVRRRQSNIESPMAEWSRSAPPGLPELVPLRDLRRHR
jgi:CRISPR/Cas system-associated exonuclease Cas4 (RecB family)